MSQADAPDPVDEAGPLDLSRRSFLKGAGGIAAGGALTAGATAQDWATAAESRRLISGTREVRLLINGEEKKVAVEPRTTLLGMLRTRLDPPLTGAKEVCDRGACGACTVLMNDQPVYACMVLAMDCQGAQIRTVEGLGEPAALSDVQQAFWEQDGLMCGFCTPGFVMSVTSCLERESDPRPEKLRKACAGNLCRCGTYPNVLAAAEKAARRLKEGR